MANEIKYEKVTATNVTASGHVSASVFYGDGSGISNIAGASGGTVTSVAAGDGLAGGTITGAGTISVDLTDTNTFTATATGDRAVVRDENGDAAFGMVVVGSNGVQTNEAFLYIPDKLNLGNGVAGSAHHKITGSVDIKNNLTASGTVTAASFHGDGSNITGLVTTANVRSADALMDDELASITDVKALNQSLTSGASPTFSTANMTDATNKRFMTDAQETKLDSVESNADVTDTTNVVAALTAGTNITIAGDGTISSTDTNTQLSTEQVQDIAGLLVATGGTKTGITVTYDDTNGDMDFVVATQSDNNFTTDLLNKLNGIETSADVTDATNVNAAGALMESEVDTNIKTLSLPASTTISTFGASLVDDANAAAARTTLGVDAAGTDNSTNVTIAAGKDYISISGQELTLGTIDISDDTNLGAGTGLAFSGDTLSVDLSELTGLSVGMTGDDQFIVLDESNSYADRRKAANEIGLSIFNNDAGFTTNTGSVTGNGTADEIPVWIGPNTIRNSGLLFLNFNSTKLGINTSSPEKTLDVDGPVKLGNDSTHSSLLTGSFNLSGSLTIQKDTSGANSDYDITFKNFNEGNLGYIYTSGLSDFVFGSSVNAWVTSVFGNTYIRSNLDVDIGAPEVFISGSSGTYIFNQSYFGGTNTSDKVSTFTSDGKLGVKDTSPAYDLDVNGDVRLGQNTSDHKIFITGSIYHNVLSGTGTSVLIKDSNNKIVTDGIDSRVFDIGDLVGRAQTGVANYVALWSGGNSITYDSSLYYDPSNNFLGIGTTSPQARLDVRRSTSTSTNNAYSKFVATFVNQNTADQTFPGPTNVDTYVMSLRIAEVSTEGGSTGDLFLACYSNSNGTSNGTREFYISGNGTTGTTFTSQHFTVYKAKSGSSALSDEIEPGMIIEAIGERGIDRDNETAIPVVSICSSRNSKKVFGVLSSDYEGIYDMAHWRYFNGVYNEDCRYEYEEEDGTITVVGEYSNESPYFKARSNSGGEGKIWITNLHGNVENGDFISSSEIAGFGALQEDDIMRSCTVAKCTEDIDWDSVVDTVEFEGQTYKKYLAFCTYHCG